MLAIYAVIDQYIEQYTILELQQKDNGWSFDAPQSSIGSSNTNKSTEIFIGLLYDH